jgi:hypothetical protein
LTGQLNSGDAAALIESVAVFVRDLRKNLTCAFAILAANQRFIAPDPAGLNVDDRLKGHRKRDSERVRVGVPAPLASHCLRHRTPAHDPKSTVDRNHGWQALRKT